MSGRAAAVAISLSFFAILLGNATPTVTALRANLARTLREGGRSGESRGGVRVRGILVATQVALSILLLVGAGLVAEAFATLLRADPGFDSADALSFRVSLTSSDYPEPERVRAFDASLREQLGALPGVTDVGGANALPLTTATNQTDVSFPGAPGNTGDANADGPLVDVFRITAGYVEAAGFRVLSGRGFEPTDGERVVALIDDVLARRFFPNGTAVGSRLAVGDTATIVGVVDQARFYSVYADDRGQIYFPFDRSPMRQMSYVVRTTVDPETLIGTVRAVVREIEPSAAVTDIRTLDAIVRASLGKQRLSLTLLVIFAGGALMIAMLGIYGVVSNGVARRTQEIGVRVALGADRATVVRMVLSHGVRLAVVGATIGVIGAIATGSLLRNVMFGVDVKNPVVYLLAAMVVVGVASLASYIPAIGATQISPVTALRAE